MTDIRSVLWQNPYDDSTELCRLVGSEAGWALEGLVLVPVEGEPARVDYRVEADAGWNTERVHLRMQGAGWERERELSHAGGRWLLDGKHDPGLDGCSDVDLRVSPSTNTLPISRLGIPVGGQATVRAAWVGFPDLEVSPSEQTYERLAEDVYRYRSGSFVADLTVDDAAMVLRYADEYWRALASG